MGAAMLSFYLITLNNSFKAGKNNSYIYNAQPYFPNLKWANINWVVGKSSMLGLILYKKAFDSEPFTYR